VRLKTPLGRRAAAVTSARSVAALAGSLALPSAVRLLWPGAASSELVALYAGLVTVAGLVLVAGLVVGGQARETDSVIELAQDTPGETLAALRREAASRADPASRYALTAAVELLESNAALQAELAEKLDEVRASRRRLIDAALMERERLERVLADGAFRYLDELTSTLQALGEDGDGAARDLAAACLDEVSRTRADLDQLAGGLHPRVLVDRGLAAALADLAASCPIPVDVRAPPDRFPATVETAVWYACAEALANVVKHARAETAVVEVRVEPDELIASIRDDGAGGARTTPGGGLAGLADRLAAVDGRLIVESRVGGGTRLRIGVPLP
jgi:signal transduction histidine kinase